MTDYLQRFWKPPGAVSAAFMASRAPLHVLNGPVGSGKTTTALVKIIRLAAAQKPSTRHTGPGGEKLRKFRATVVRNTYRDLWRSTIASWHKLVPRDVGDWSGGDNGPATHKIMFRRGGELVALWVDFLAIGDHAVEDVLRGYENTALYANELDLLPAEELLAYAEQRVGRYPEMDEGGPTWRGVIADCNAPEFDTWVYDTIFVPPRAELARKGIELFIQPGGLDPDAENLENLPDGRAYYTRGIERQPDWYVQRMINNRPGYSRAGKPIYPEFGDRRHVATFDIAPIAHLPLVIGIDGGRSPAAAFCQHLGDGQWRVLDELVTGHGTGQTRFAEMLSQRLAERFPECNLVRAWGDPAAAYGGDTEDLSWLEIVAAKSGLRIDPAPTNAPGPRWEAVRQALRGGLDGGTPRFLLAPRCKVLRAGFNNGYRFRKMAVAGAVRYDDAAEKNDYSHVHDALQYAMLGGGEYYEVLGRTQANARLLRQSAAESAYDPWRVE